MGLKMLLNIKNIKELNKFISNVSPFQPFRKTKFIEAHAKALGFKSYNSLVAKLKETSITFVAQIYLDNLSHFLSKELNNGKLFNEINDIRLYIKNYDNSKFKSWTKLQILQKVMEETEKDFDIFNFDGSMDMPEYREDISKEYKVLKDAEKAWRDATKNYNRFTHKKEFTDLIKNMVTPISERNLHVFCFDIDFLINSTDVLSVTTGDYFISEDKVKISEQLEKIKNTIDLRNLEKLLIDTGFNFGDFKDINISDQITTTNHPETPLYLEEGIELFDDDYHNTKNVISKLTVFPTSFLKSRHVLVIDWFTPYNESSLKRPLVNARLYLLVDNKSSFNFRVLDENNTVSYLNINKSLNIVDENTHRTSENINSKFNLTITRVRESSFTYSDSHVNSYYCITEFDKTYGFKYPTRTLWCQKF